MDIANFENKIILADCFDILKQLPEKCIEKNQEYFDLSVERLKNFRKEPTLWKS